MSDELNIDEQIKQIDSNIEVQEWHMARAEALGRLVKNEDFRLVFIEGFLEMEAERVFSLLVHPLTAKPDDKESYLSQLDTIKNMGRYFGTEEYEGTVSLLGRNAAKAKDELIAMKQELLADGGE